MERTNTVKMTDLPKSSLHIYYHVYSSSILKKPESILHSHRKNQSQNMLDALKTRTFEETLNKKNTITLPPYIISNYAIEPEQ